LQRQLRSLTLPARLPSPDLEPNPRASQTMSSGKHILIIDDEEAVCWSLARALTRAGHSVLTAVSAEQAVDLLARQSADVIILDVRLPGMDGLTALARLREQGDVPVIVITAFGSLPTAVQAVEGGAFDYLAKPFDLAQALQAVERALQRRQMVE